MGDQLETTKHGTATRAAPSEALRVTRPAPVLGNHQEAALMQAPTPALLRARPRLHVAPFKVLHLEQVLRLHAEVFGPGQAAHFATRWSWQQCQSPGAEETPKWVLLDDGRVRGFLATVALPYLIAGTRVVAHTPSDYMVHPDYRFHGIKLMQSFFRTCPNCVTCDDIPATIKVTQWLGARNAGRLQRYVKVLDARAIGVRMGWHKALWPLLWPANVPLAGQDRLRRTGAGPRPTVQATTELDARFERFRDRQAVVVPVALAKNLRFLGWRYGGRSPHAERQIGIVSAGGELAGYVILYGGRQSHTGYIFDLQVSRPGDSAVATALLDFACDWLRRRGMWLVRFHQVSNAGAVPNDVLGAVGFVRRGWHQLLVRFQDQQLAAIAAQEGNWSLAYGDCEASYSAL